MKFSNFIVDELHTLSKSFYKYNDLYFIALQSNFQFTAIVCQEAGLILENKFELVCLKPTLK